MYFQVSECRLSLMWTITNLILIASSVVKAYHYTSITSVMLLDWFTIPRAIIFAWFFLKTKYRFKKLTVQWSVLLVLLLSSFQMFMQVTEQVSMHYFTKLILTLCCSFTWSKLFKCCTHNYTVWSVKTKKVCLPDLIW